MFEGDHNGGNYIQPKLLGFWLQLSCSYLINVQLKLNLYQIIYLLRAELLSDLSVYSPVPNMVQALGCPLLPNSTIAIMCEKSSNHQVVQLKIYIVFISQLFLNTDVPKERKKKKKRVPKSHCQSKAKGPIFFLSLRQRESPSHRMSAVQEEPQQPAHTIYFSGHLEAW